MSPLPKVKTESDLKQGWYWIKWPEGDLAFHREQYAYCSSPTLHYPFTVNEEPCAFEEFEGVWGPVPRPELEEEFHVQEET